MESPPENRLAKNLDAPEFVPMEAKVPDPWLEPTLRWDYNFHFKKPKHVNFPGEELQIEIEESNNTLLDQELDSNISEQAESESASTVASLFTQSSKDSGRVNISTLDRRLEQRQKQIDYGKVREINARIRLVTNDIFLK